MNPKHCAIKSGLEARVFGGVEKFHKLSDKTRAKSAYEDFLNLWKDADSEVPIFKQAKAEYSRLR